MFKLPMEKIRLSTSYSSMQVSAAILLLVTRYLPIVVYLIHLNKVYKQRPATSPPPPPPLLTLLVLDGCCLVPSNSVYNLQIQCIQQAKCTFHPSDVTDHFIGWKSIPGCRTERSCVIKSSTINHQIYNKNQCIFMAYPTKISSTLWLSNINISLLIF